MTTVSKAEFRQNTDRAFEAAAEGPVFITERDKPTGVLLSIEEYQRITGMKRSLIDVVSMPGLSDIELDIPPRRSMPRPADFT